MTLELAHLIYQQTIKQAKEAGIKPKHDLIVWHSAPVWDEETQSFSVQDWTFGAIRDKALRFMALNNKR